MSKLKQTGFTFFEILIAVSIASVAGVMLIGILSQNSELFSNQNIKISQGIELNNAKPIIEEAIKSSGGIVSQYPLTGQPTYTSGAEAIVLSVPSINAQGSVINNTYDYIAIYKDPQNAKLLKKQLIPNAGSSRKAENKVLLTKLSSLEFRYYNSANQIISPVQATKVRYIINIADLISTETKTSSISGQINLRND